MERWVIPKDIGISKRGNDSQTNVLSKPWQDTWVTAGIGTDSQILDLSIKIS